jgi:hypothetical protein
MKIALTVVFTIAIIATSLFMIQGGFGDKGSFDRVLMILALPWAMIHWPDFVWEQPFLFLVLIPFFGNIACVLVGYWCLRKDATAI